MDEVVAMCSIGLHRSRCVRFPFGGDNSSCFVNGEIAQGGFRRPPRWRRGP